MNMIDANLLNGPEYTTRVPGRNGVFVQDLLLPFGEKLAAHLGMGINVFVTPPHEWLDAPSRCVHRTNWAYPMDGRNYRLMGRFDNFGVRFAGPPNNLNHYDPENNVCAYWLKQLSGCCAIVVSFHTMVKAAYQGKGISHMLMEHKLEVAKLFGYTTMLLTDIPNEPQRHVMAKAGFTDLMTTKNNRTSNRVTLSFVQILPDHLVSVEPSKVTVEDRTAEIVMGERGCPLEDMSDTIDVLMAAETTPEELRTNA